MVHWRNQGRDRAQEREENLQDSQVKQKNKKHMNTTKLQELSPAKLKKKLTKRVIKYSPEGESSVRADGRDRTLFLRVITKDGIAIAKGHRYLGIMSSDLDDGGVLKPRNIQVARITEVSGRFMTAVRMIKTLF